MEQKTYYIEISSGRDTQSASDSPLELRNRSNSRRDTNIRSYFDQNEEVIS